MSKEKVKSIKAYQAADGTLFSTRADAEIHNGKNRLRREYDEDAFICSDCGCVAVSSGEMIDWICSHREAVLETLGEA